MAALGCSQRAAEYAPQMTESPVTVSTERTYRFGVPPMRTTRRLWAVYAPFLEELNRQLRGFTLRLESAQIEPSYDAKVRRGDLELALVAPHRVLDLEQLGYEVIVRASNADRIAGMVVLAADSPIRRARDLKGKTVVFPSRDALASAMLVKAHLKEAGIDVDRSANVIFSGSDESALQMVAVGAADAAGVSRATWHRICASDPEFAQRLKIKWETIELPGRAVMANRRLQADDRKQVAAALLAMRQTEAGRAALQGIGIRGFHVGEAASYDELWEFLEAYNRLFRVRPSGGRS